MCVGEHGCEALMRIILRIISFETRLEGFLVSYIIIHQVFDAPPVSRR